jgi:hypothetical protein
MGTRAGIVCMVGDSATVFEQDSGAASMQVSIRVRGETTARSDEVINNRNMDRPSKYPVLQPWICFCSSNSF